MTPAIERGFPGTANKLKPAALNSGAKPSKRFVRYSRTDASGDQRPIANPDALTATKYETQA